MDKLWFKKWFNSKEYLELYKHRNERDALKLIDLVLKNVKLEKNARILDAACGSGRHAFILAKKGYNVTGADISKFLINTARKTLNQKFSKIKNRINFIITDLRELNYKKEFNLALNLFSSFGYFESDKENEKIIRNISRALVKEGVFVLDFLNKYFVENNLADLDVKKVKDKVLIQNRKLLRNLVIKDIYIIEYNKSKSKPVIRRHNEMIKLYSLEDFKLLFERNGLAIVKTFGGYDGSKYNRYKSSRLIIFAKKIVG